MKSNHFEQDFKRYIDGKGMPKFQKYFRKSQDAANGFLKSYYRFLFAHYKKKNMVEMSSNTKIGDGLYIGHPYGITINPDAVIGKNVNIHKGLTIGQENRGHRKGTPSIGDCVWIGVNVTIVGKITIGSDVLIAPNTYVNCNVPNHSVVFGNPCIIKHKENATVEYINNRV